MIRTFHHEFSSARIFGIGWADHPETLWSDNLLISSDFPHFLREGIEKGVYIEDSLVFEGVGGTAVYFNGAIGGLMTTKPSFEVAFDRVERICCEICNSIHSNPQKMIRKSNIEHPYIEGNA